MWSVGFCNQKKLGLTTLTVSLLFCLKTIKSQVQSITLIILAVIMKLDSIIIWSWWINRHWFFVCLVLDPWSGELYNLSATFLTGLKYNFIKFGPETDIPASAKFVATISSRYEMMTSAKVHFLKTNK